MVDIIGRARIIVESQIDKSSIDSTGGTLGAGLKKTAVVGVAALGALAAASVKASLAFEEAESTQRKLANTLGNMGKSGAVQAVDKLSDSLSRKTGIDDQVIQKGQTILATFSQVASSAGVAGGAFERATKASADLAVSGFGNVDGAAKALGKALQDPEKGISALSRAGVTFTPIQKQQIEDFVKGGEVAKAQALILKEVEKQVGGNAEAGAKGSDKLRNAFGELEESFGNLLNTVTGGDNFSSLADSIQDVADQIDRFANSEGLKNFFAVLDREAELPGEGTVLAPGAEREEAFPSPLGEALTADAEEQGATWWQKFLLGVEDEANNSLEKTKEEFKLIGEVWADALDGGIVDGVSNALENAEAAIGEWFEDVKTNWREGWQDITNIWPEIQAAFEKDWDNLVEDIKAIPDRIGETVDDWTDAGSKLISGFIEGLKSKVDGLFDFKTIINNALGLPRSITLGDGPGGIIPDKSFTIKAFAGGVRNFGGGLAVVGETGPELVGLPAGSNVYSTSESGRMATGDITNVFNINTVGPVGPSLLQELNWWGKYAQPEAVTV